MGFIKKWGKIIIAVIVFVGILRLVVRVPGAESTGVLTPYPTEIPTLDLAAPPVFATTPEPTELPTVVPTPISVEAPQTTSSPIPTSTQPLPIPTSTPSSTQSPLISTSTPKPTSSPLPSPTPTPKTSPSVSQTQVPPTIPLEEEKQDMSQEVQDNTCALGHDFNTSVWETATCLKGGYYNNVCQRCGLVESVTEEPLSHDVEDILIQEGNCMQDTVIRHICKSCGQQVESDTRYTPEVHKWSSAVVDDMQIFYCEWCGVVQ